MGNRGTYGSLADLKADLGITDTAQDARLRVILEEASAVVDDLCHRHFYVSLETRYYTASRRDVLLVEDLLVVAALSTDEDDDRDYDYAWVDTDFDLEPINAWPKHRILVAPQGRYTFPPNPRGVRIVGQWGYGDGWNSTPYQGSTTTIAEALDDSETDVDVASGAALAAGQNILVESEQMYITAISGNTLTVERGINGTTAAAHASGKAIYFYRYPPAVASACRLLAARMWNRPNAPFGVTGSADLGMIRVNPRDPDIIGPLSPYVLSVVA